MLRRKRDSRRSWLHFITGPDGMMFSLTDLKEMVGSVRWFLGEGPRPQYGRWTCREKFDYLAVFWGVAPDRPGRALLGNRNGDPDPVRDIVQLPIRRHR